MSQPPKSASSRHHAQNAKRRGPQKGGRPSNTSRQAAKGSAKSAAKSGDVARQAAFTVLDGVVRNGRSMDDIWVELTTDQGLLVGAEPRDRAFCRRLSATALRHVRSIDDILRQRLNSWPKGSVISVLRLGVAELVHLGTPGHAAVSRMVELVGPKGPRGLVNAVLRRVAESVEAGDMGPAPADQDVPPWLMKRWTRTYGADGAAAIASASLIEAALDITVPHDSQTWAQKLGGMLLPTGSVRLAAGGMVTDLPGFQEGAWWVQDAAAALPVTLMGDVSGQRIADICAAPGGKTAQLAAAGAIVLALDLSDVRLQRLAENMARLNLTAETLVADVMDWQPDALLDGILLDAPCSATGTLRRHPDLMHLKSGSDVIALAALQAEMLDHVAQFVKPGGTLLYCTCSLEPEEGESQIAAFLDRTPSYGRVAVTASEVGDQSTFLTPEGDVRLRPDMWADHGGLDGFFMSRLVRSS